MSSPDIKNLKEATFEQWYPLWQGYQNFYQIEIPEEVSEYTWTRLTSDKHPEFYGFAAFVGSELAGIAHVIEHSNCWTKEPYAYLQDLFVAPKFRQQGIARALMQAIYDQTKSRGCARVWWLTHESNQPAVSLYEEIANRTGFIHFRGF